MLDHLQPSFERLNSDEVFSQCEFGRSQIYEWRNEVRPRKQREPKQLREETVKNTVDVIMTYPHFSGRKGQAYMIYHRLGYASMNSYDKIKKAVGRLLKQEVSKRKLLPRQPSYEHVRADKVGQIWAEDFTDLVVYAQTFKFAMVVDVADQYIMGGNVTNRANDALVAEPVEQALAANEGKGPEEFLISDNGKQYVSDEHGRMLDKAEIVHKRIPACRPQYNGSVECGIKEFKNIFYNVFAERERKGADKEKPLPFRVRGAVKETVRRCNEVIPRPSLGGVTPADVHQGLGPAKIEANRRYLQQEQERPEGPPWKRTYWDVVKEAMNLENRSRLEMLTKFCFFLRRPLRTFVKLVGKVYKDFSSPLSAVATN